MSKAKFILTEDLVKVEPEPVVFNKEKIIKDITKNKDRISLNIDFFLKKNLHIYCINNNKKMTDIIELAIKKYLENN